MKTDGTGKPNRMVRYLSYLSDQVSYTCNDSLRKSKGSMCVWRCGADLHHADPWLCNDDAIHPTRFEGFGG
jgi:hypothetical protein